jgi:hypothetical protein
MSPGTHLMGDSVGLVFDLNESKKRDILKPSRKSNHDFLNIKLEPYSLHWLSHPSPDNLILLKPSQLNLIWVH